MFSEQNLSTYKQQFFDLITIARESERRTVKDPVDELFDAHLNVFTKSYIVSACSILEAFIQDIAFAFTAEMAKRISDANVPRNILVWAISGETKKGDFKFEQFNIGLKKKDISDIVSGNFFKTIKVFEKIGIEIEKDSDFLRFSDSIGSAVDKRNKIVHHNDNASDMSMKDVIVMIETFERYTRCIYDIVRRSPHLS